jgi:hypothetical protein
VNRQQAPPQPQVDPALDPTNTTLFVGNIGADVDELVLRRCAHLCAEAGGCAV